MESLTDRAKPMLTGPGSRPPLSIRSTVGWPRRARRARRASRKAANCGSRRLVGTHRDDDDEGWIRDGDGEGRRRARARGPRGRSGQRVDGGASRRGLPHEPLAARLGFAAEDVNVARGGVAWLAHRNGVGGVGDGRRSQNRGFRSHRALQGRRTRTRRRRTRTRRRRRRRRGLRDGREGNARADRRLTGCCRCQTARGRAGGGVGDQLPRGKPRGRRRRAPPSPRRKPQSCEGGGGRAGEAGGGRERRRRFERGRRRAEAARIAASVQSAGRRHAVEGTVRDGGGGAKGAEEGEEPWEKERSPGKKERSPGKKERSPEKERGARRRRRGAGEGRGARGRRRSPGCSRCDGSDAPRGRGAARTDRTSRERRTYAPPRGARVAARGDQTNAGGGPRGERRRAGRVVARGRAHALGAAGKRKGVDDDTSTTTTTRATRGSRPRPTRREPAGRDARRPNLERDGARRGFERRRRRRRRHSWRGVPSRPNRRERIRHRDTGYVRSPRARGARARGTRGPRFESAIRRTSQTSRARGGARVTRAPAQAERTASASSSAVGAQRREGCGFSASLCRGGAVGGRGEARARRLFRQEAGP